jgi:hypothetical protein
MAAHVAFVKGLARQGYQVAQGNAYLLVNSDCPIYVGIFGSCFGNNAAAPYIIPQPPIEQSYVDPLYAAPLNTTGPDDSTTNIIYRLGDQDALITLVSFPPKAAYLGYQSYVFTSETSNYPNPDPLQVLSPDPERYEIFGSIGNDINDVVVQNQYGTPWGGRPVMFITTSNQQVADDLVAKATAKGIDPRSVFIEPAGSNAIYGNGSNADDLVTLIRYALSKNSSAGSNWLSHLSKNVIVYKVTSGSTAVTAYPENQYTTRTGNSELQLQPQLNELSSLLQAWLIANTPPTETVATKPMDRTTADTPEGVPHGLVGADCISKGTVCLGDNEDTSTYAFSAEVTLSDTDTLFVAGINHNQLNNSSYLSLDIYNATQFAGVASTAQTNPSATGFNSGTLTGSAQAVLQDLGLYASASDALKAALPDLYVTLVSKNCSVATAYCVDLKGDTLLQAGVPINIYERQYVHPGTTAGANTNVMIFPNVISPGFD